MISVLIDASVILKTLLLESDSVARVFEKLLLETKEGKVELLSGRIVVFEVANGIRFSERNIQSAHNYLSKFFELPLKYVLPDDSDLQKILDSSYKYGTTVYDTSYHILAKAHNATFLTCDEEYFKKAKELGDIELVL